jgi:hypothetical protein
VAAAILRNIGDAPINRRFWPVNGDPFAIQALTMTGAANVVFTSSSYLLPSTLRVNSDTGSSSQTVLVADGTTLSLGASGGIFQPDRVLHLTVGEKLDVRNGGILNVGFGSQVTTSRSDVQNGGEVNVNGSGSRLISNSFLTLGTTTAGVSKIRIQNGGTFAGQSLYRRLLKEGVTIFEYEPQILHAKLIIIDDIVYVGSANLDQRSLHLNYELMLRFQNPEFAGQARALFENMGRNCRHITSESWRQSRTLWGRIKRRWAYLLLVRIDPYIARWQWRGMPD